MQLWIAPYKKEQLEIPPEASALIAEHARIQELEKQVKKLQNASKQLNDRPQKVLGYETLVNTLLYSVPLAVESTVAFFSKSLS